MPFSQRTRSSPVMCNLARQPRSKTANPERSAANSRATSPKLAMLWVPRYSPIGAPAVASLSCKDVSGMTKPLIIADATAAVSTRRIQNPFTTEDAEEHGGIWTTRPTGRNELNRHTALVVILSPPRTKDPYPTRSVMLNRDASTLAQHDG